MPSIPQGLPRGIRNNNPGNIEHGADWLGLADEQPDDRFCTFNSMAFGIRAMGKILRAYERRGIVSIAGLIHTWAPPRPFRTAPIENDTAAYVKDVAAHCMVAPGMAYPLNAVNLSKLIEAISIHENGGEYLSQASLDQAMLMLFPNKKA